MISRSIEACTGTTGLGGQLHVRVGMPTWRMPVPRVCPVLGGARVLHDGGADVAVIVAHRGASIVRTVEVLPVLERKRFDTNRR